MKHQTPIQIRFKDLDSLGHVNNANHITYLELARVKYFHEVINEPIEWNKAGFIIARHEIDYKLPVLLEDKLVVHTSVTRIGSKSFDFEYQLIRENAPEHAKIAVVAKSVIVCFNFETHQSVAVPESWINKIKAFEGN
ncbi:MAG: acyl-CoA thioesterase [Bacteroidetes bacterium]|nr:acyl-CoA thioesterase [Bacteroidota bacterium]